MWQICVFNKFIYAQIEVGLKLLIARPHVYFYISYQLNVINFLV